MVDFELVAGVDEAGRGPLAGPVMAAAVILDPGSAISGLDDSKKLSPSKRQSLELEIKDKAFCWSVAQASVEEIDEINILQASMLAMRRAVEGLKVQPKRALIDGNRIPKLSCAATAIVGGDALHAEISAASILAKEARDRLMVELSSSFPGYGFEKHKGYPTKHHLQALANQGVCCHHRKSFGPVRELLGGS